MTKGTLQYDLPEERHEFQTAINGGKYRALIGELDDFMRTKIKHTDLSKETRELFEEMRNIISEEVGMDE